MTTPARACLAIAAADELAHANAILGAELLIINHGGVSAHKGHPCRRALTGSDAIATSLRFIASGSQPAPGFVHSAGQRLLSAEKVLAHYERHASGNQAFEPWPPGVLPRYQAARLRLRQIGLLFTKLANESCLAEPKELFGLS